MVISDGMVMERMILSQLSNLSGCTDVHLLPREAH